MAKLTGPLLSMGASGKIGKTLVMGKSRGIAYARQYVIPANPKTVAQTANRVRFAFLTEMYKLAGAIIRSPWDAFATGRPFHGSNKFVGDNLRLIGSETDLALMNMSPGARGGLPPVSVTVSDSATANSVDVTVSVPTNLPEGWTIYGVGAAACVDQDANGIFTGAFPSGEDLTAPYTVTLGGFAVDDVIRGWGWVIYNKPNGTKAYSVSLNDTATIA